MGGPPKPNTPPRNQSAPPAPEAKAALPRNQRVLLDVFSQKTKAPARNADPRRRVCFQNVLSKKNKAPARNADPRRGACFQNEFSQKTNPLLGTLIRDGQLFSGCVFPDNKSPVARNADPRRTTFFQDVFFPENKSPC